MALHELSLVPETDLPGDELVPGTVLFHGQYTIKRYINSGGFGITYLASDSLEREVVIKECFASSFCRRHQSRVSARSAQNREALQKVIRYFLKEARSLSRLSHPNIVGVHQVFEDNDTAYMALDYIRGTDLYEVIETGAPALQPADVIALTRKLVGALQYVHDSDLLHGDISPDNIFLNQDGEPILIDFGAARKYLANEHTRYSGLAVVKDGYSPHEFYFTGGNYGPWSDLYALAATIYHVVSGQAPVSSQLRVSAIAEGRGDPCLPLAGRFPDYPAAFLESLDRAMCAMPAKRFQSAGDWMAALDLLQPVPKKAEPAVRKAWSAKSAAKRGKPQTTVLVDPAPDLSGPALEPVANGPDLSALATIAGFVGGCLVEGMSGAVLGAIGGGGIDLIAAGAANAAVVQAKQRALRSLGLEDSVEDIVVTMGRQLHLLHPLGSNAARFLYVVLDKKAANLGLARVQVRRLDGVLSQ